MRTLIKYAVKFERIVKFIGSIGIIFSAFLFITTIQRNSEADVATAWQLLSQEKSGNYGRAHAINTLASSQCLIKEDYNKYIDSFLYGRNNKLKQCYISGRLILNGPQSLFGIDLSSKDSGISLLDKLFLSSVELRSNNFGGSSIKSSVIANSDIFDTNFSGFYTSSSRFIGNDLSAVNMNCSYITRTTLHDNIAKNFSLNYAKIIFSVFDFHKSEKPSEKSFLIEIQNTTILDSIVNLSNLRAVNIKNSKFIRSEITFDKNQYLSINDANFSDSRIYGDMTTNRSPVFIDTNLSGADLSQLAGLDPGDLDKSFYCNTNKPVIPSYYRGNGPKNKQCISDIPEKLMLTLQELQKNYPQYTSISPLKVYYMPVENDDASKLACGGRSTAIEKLSKGIGVLLFEKGKIATFSNMSTDQPVAGQIIEIGHERGAETKDKLKNR